MKGSIDIPITIIAAVLVILTIVLAVNSLKQATGVMACNNYFKNTIETIINRACEMSDSDVDDTSATIDLKDCVKTVEFDENGGESGNAVLIYQMKGENQPLKYSTACYYGSIIGYVTFDFSKVGNILDSKKRNEYNIIITNNKVLVPQCQGENCYSYTQNTDLDNDGNLCTDQNQDEKNNNCECHRGCEWLDE